MEKTLEEPVLKEDSSSKVCSCWSCDCGDPEHEEHFTCLNCRNGQTIQTDIRNYLHEFGVAAETDDSTRMVDVHTTVDTGERQLGPRGSHYKTMADFLRNDAEGYKLLAEEIEKVGSGFFQYTCGTETVSTTGRYISDVFLYSGRRQLNSIMDILRKYGESRRKGMFGYSVEDDHIHIIHDCAFSGRSCRCTFKEKIEPFGEFGPNRKYNKPLWKFTRTDWYDVFIYFFLAKRGARKIWIRGKDWKIPNDGR